MPATATPAEWQTLAARIAAAARRDGIPAADADDIAQDIIARHLEGRFAGRCENTQGGDYPSPAAMAAAAEAKGFPVDRIHAAYGIGPQSLHEAGWTPTVKEQTTSPATLTRCPVGDTDPNPASRLAARERCLAELVALAAGSITPRPRTAEPELTAAEQAKQARAAWKAHKARAAKADR
jgi:hypothetical protein